MWIVYIAGNMTILSHHIVSKMPPQSETETFYLPNTINVQELLLLGNAESGHVTRVITWSPPITDVSLS